MHPTEEWRPTHHPNYEVSNLGRVRSSYGRALRILKPTRQKGYPAVGFHTAGRSRFQRIHRLVAAAFLGPCPKGQEVCHKDHDKENACLTNLEYGTHRRNMKDSVFSGQWHASKLTVDDVLKIRQLYDEGIIQIRLAKQFSVSQSQISAIVRGEKWSYAP